MKPSVSHNPDLTQALVDLFNSTLGQSHQTILVGGFSEPVYLPHVNGRPAEIRFTRDYWRSALHEIAHWCVAGAERRRLPDFGYWYRPDGRSLNEQRVFFEVEVKPQALERAFCEALGCPFEVSCDNLSGEGISPLQIHTFDQAVCLQLNTYRALGFPTRARQFIESCERFYNSGSSHDNSSPQTRSMVPSLL